VRSDQAVRSQYREAADNSLPDSRRLTAAAGSPGWPGQPEARCCRTALRPEECSTSSRTTNCPTEPRRAERPERCSAKKPAERRWAQCWRNHSSHTPSAAVPQQAR